MKGWEKEQGCSSSCDEDKGKKELYTHQHLVVIKWSYERMASGLTLTLALTHVVESANEVGWESKGRRKKQVKRRQKGMHAS